MKTQTMITTFAAGLTAIGSASAGLIANGDFEAGPSIPSGATVAVVADWDFWTEVSGSGSVVGWLEGVHISGAVSVADSGDAGTVVANIAALNAIEQDITTEIGKTYKLTYDLGGLGGSAAPAYVSTVEIRADGALIDTKNVTQTAGGAGFFNSFSVNFVATDTTTTIRFENTVDPTGDDFGPVLDNVDVTLVPEPSSLALMGLGGLLVARRRRA